MLNVQVVPMVTPIHQYRLLTQIKSEFFVPVAYTRLRLYVLQMELGPGVGHGFGLFYRMFPRRLSGLKTNISLTVCFFYMEKTVSKER